MLVLSRKTGEAIVIAKDIRITVIKLGRNRVKLGITGPAEVPIHREELSFRIEEESPVAVSCKHGQSRVRPRLVARKTGMNSTSGGSVLQ